MDRVRVLAWPSSKKKRPGYHKSFRMRAALALVHDPNCNPVKPVILDASKYDLVKTQENAVKHNESKKWCRSYSGRNLDNDGRLHLFRRRVSALPATTSAAGILPDKPRFPAGKSANGNPPCRTRHCGPRKRGPIRLVRCRPQENL